MTNEEQMARLQALQKNLKQWDDSASEAIQWAIEEIALLKESRRRVMDLAMDTVKAILAAAGDQPQPKTATTKTQ